MASPLDSIDRHIVLALQSNARTSNADIARELDMAPSAILERIRKLEQRGIILGYEARLAPRLLGLGLTAFSFVRAAGTVPGKTLAAALVALDQVMEVHHVAGEDCLFVKMRVQDTDELSRTLDVVKAIPGISATRTTIVLSTEKESSRLPLTTP